MSIATLKKKSNTLYSTGINFNTVSVNKVGFSLNGISRPVGVVGPTNLAKSVTRTPFRGTTPVGYGGGSSCRVSGWRARKNKCTGLEYPIVISNSGSCQTPQTLVKPSTMNTKGMIEMKYMGILHGTQPKMTVQVGVGDPLQTSQGTYLQTLDRQAFACSNAITKETYGMPAAYENTCNITKYLDPLQTSYDVYNTKLSALCNVTHYPGLVNNSACSVKK